jgi:DNA-binding CsgD family transcriptional regulator
MARARQKRIVLTRFLIQPCGLARSRWEWPFAAVCIAALAIVFVLEIATPDDVVGSLGFVPVFAALWTLSNRPALAVASCAPVLLAVVVLAEPQNRPTIASVACAGTVIAVLLRLHASGLARVLAAHRRPHLLDFQRISSATISALEGPARGVQALTRRELEVARLASEGYMAGEIGQLLHISERTVESHLAHAYDKLGINRRNRLIRMEAELHP